jgi:hypothetical protein
MMNRSFVCSLLFSIAVFLLAAFLVQSFGQGTPFTHKDISLTLPEGWVTQDIPGNFEKETVAWLKSEKIAGASILVFCYKGRRQNYASVRIAGLKTIGSSYPKGQEMVKKPEKIKTDTGLTAVYEYWRGAVEASGQTVLLESPMGIFESKSGWILMLGFTPSASGPRLEEDFLKILKSAK